MDHDYNPHNGICRTCGEYSPEHDGLARHYREREQAQRQEREEFYADPANAGKFYTPSPGTWLD